MNKRPRDYNNDIQPGTETISQESKNKIIGLGYEDWLKKEQSKGFYTAEFSDYHPQTVKEFLIYYRENEQKKWKKERYGSKNQVSEFRFLGQGYEALDGNTYAKYNILSAFENDNNSDIRRLNNAGLESFINRVYENKNRTFNDVNKVDSDQEGLWRKFLSKISHFLETRKINSGPLKEAPRAPQDPQSLRRAQSMPTSFKFNYKSPNHQTQSFNDDSTRKRKIDNQQNSGPDQGHPKRTKSARDSGYFEAYSSRNKNKIAAAEDARFEREKEFQERQNAERKRKEEEKAKQKAKKPQQPQRASSFPSQRASQIHNPLIDPRTGRLGKAPPSQTSSLTRNSPSIPPALNKNPNTRSASQKPGPNPRRPLGATPANSRVTVPRPR